MCKTTVSGVYIILYIYIATISAVVSDFGLDEERYYIWKRLSGGPHSKDLSGDGRKGTL